MLMLFLIHLINCFDIWVHISVMVHNIIFPNGCFTVWTGYMTLVHGILREDLDGVLTGLQPVKTGN